MPQPNAAVLPAKKVVMELLEVSSHCAEFGRQDCHDLVDQRMKHWTTGDKDYQLDDMTKKTLMGEDKAYQLGDITKKTMMGDKKYQFRDLAKQAVSKFTTKDSYTFGDFTQ